MTEHAISDTLFPMLRERFPDRGMRLESRPEPCAIFPAVHQDVGDIEVCDDGDEVTVYAGKFTHGHFSNYNELSQTEKAQIISADVVEFLDAVFSDQVVFWGSHEGGGGWHRIDIGPYEDPEAGEYVWSGPRNVI
jgi:hypothetical protein